MPPHNPLPCYNLCLFYIPPQVLFQILLISFWMTSCHDVFGRPGLLFPWDGFQWYSLLGIRSMFIRCTKTLRTVTTSCNTLEMVILKRKRGENIRTGQRAWMQYVSVLLFSYNKKRGYLKLKHISMNVVNHLDIVK